MSTFDAWNTVKKKVDERGFPGFYIREREVWYTRMGKNVGCEEDGKTDFLRPVLVLKKVGSLFFVAAMTTRGKEESPFYHQLETGVYSGTAEKHQTESWVILSQVKVMDKRRFEVKIGTVGKDEFVTLQKKLKTLLF